MQYQIMIKAAGIFFLISAGLLAGRQMSCDLKKRKDFFSESVRLIQYLEKEMFEQRAGMNEALYEASVLFDNPWKDILKEMSELVISYSGNTFAELWCEVIKKRIKKSFLHDDEWYVFIHMSSFFGGGDTAVQKTLMKNYLERLKEMEKRASEEYEKKGDLYQKLSLFAAVFLILILI